LEKILHKKRAGGMAQDIGLSSSPSSEKQNKTKQKTIKKTGW
jgi:hypothetical protein